MSETGVVPLDESKVAEKGRLGPGQMVSVDLSTGETACDGDNNKLISLQICCM
jgi:hypothetical protein